MADDVCTCDDLVNNGDHYCPIHGTFARSREQLTDENATLRARVAELERERKEALDILWDDIDDNRDPKLTLVQVAAKAANAIHWRGVNGDCAAAAADDWRIKAEALQSRLTQLEGAARELDAAIVTEFGDPSEGITDDIDKALLRLRAVLTPAQQTKQEAPDER